MLYVFYDTLAKAEGRGSRRVHIISGGSVVLIYNVIWAFFLRQNFVSALICTGKLKSKKLKKIPKNLGFFQSSNTKMVYSIVSQCITDNVHAVQATRTFSRKKLL